MPNTMTIRSIPRQNAGGFERKKAGRESVSSRGCFLFMISPSRWLYRGSFVVALTAMLMISGAYTIGNEPEHVSLEESKIREAIEAALPLLEKSSNGSAEQRKCFTCHSQALPVMALSEARLRNFEVDTNNYERQIKHTATHLRKGKKTTPRERGRAVVLIQLVTPYGLLKWAITLPIPLLMLSHTSCWHRLGIPIIGNAVAIGHRPNQVILQPRILRSAH